MPYCNVLPTVHLPSRDAYIQPIHQGMQMQYEPMKRLVMEALGGSAA